MGMTCGSRLRSRSCQHGCLSASESALYFSPMDTNTTTQVVNGPVDLSWLHRELWGNEVWHYLVLFGYVVDAVFLSKLAGVAMSRRFEVLVRGQMAAIADK